MLNTLEGEGRPGNKSDFKVTVGACVAPNTRVNNTYVTGNANLGPSILKGNHEVLILASDLCIKSEVRNTCLCKKLLCLVYVVLKLWSGLIVASLRRWDKRLSRFGNTRKNGAANGISVNCHRECLTNANIFEILALKVQVYKLRGCRSVVDNLFGDRLIILVLLDKRLRNKDQVNIVILVVKNTGVSIVNVDKSELIQARLALMVVSKSLKNNFCGAVIRDKLVSTGTNEVGLSTPCLTGFFASLLWVDNSVELSHNCIKG